MAKKVKLETDDIFLDDDLGLDDLGFDADFNDLGKDDRSPVTKVTDGVVTGFKETLTNPAFLKKNLKRTLPPGYGAAMDLADTATDGVKQLYDNAARELKPVVKDVKRVTGKLLPMFDGMLPNSWASQLKEWSKEEKSFQQQEIDQKEATIQSSIGQIFGQMEMANQQRDAESRVSDALNDVVEKKRFESNFGQLNEMRMGITTLASYKKTIESQFQRKSLELQYRSYYALADLLVEQKGFNENAKAKLEGIMKNTGLPEIVKTQNSEYFKDIMKNQFLGGIHDGIFGGRRDFVKNLTNGLVKRGTEGIRNFKDSFVNGLSAAEMGADQIQMMQESGMMDPMQMGGEMAGGGLAERAGAWTSKKLKGILGKHEGLNRWGNRIMHEVGNLPQTAKEWAEGYSGESGMFGGLVGNVKDEIRSQFGREQYAHIDKGESLNEPGQFTRRTDKSINEVIPGLLARILQEQQITRTGNDKIDLIAYDYNAGKFSTNKGIAHRLSKIFDKEYMHHNIKRDTKGLIDQVDPDGTKFTKEQRAELERALLQANIDGKKPTKEFFSDSFNYRGKHADDIAETFRNYFGEDKDYSKQVAIGNKFREIGTGNRIDYKKIQDLVHLGQAQHLQAAGIIDEHGRIQERKMLMDALQYDPESAKAEPEIITAQNSPKVTQHVPFKQRKGVPQVEPQTPRAQAVVQASASALDTGALKAQTNLLERIAKSQEEIAANLKNQGRAEPEVLTGHVVDIKALLGKIYERLEMGLFIAGIGETTSQGPKEGPWYNRSLKDLFGSAKSGLKAKAGQAWAKGLSAKNFAMDKFGKAKDFVKSKWPDWKAKLEGKLGKVKDKLTDLKNKAYDVYVQVDGEAKLLISAMDIRDKKFFDQATGNPITKLGDIKGPVVDEKGNVVITQDQIDKLYIFTERGQVMLSRLSDFKASIPARLADAKAKVKGWLGLGKNKVTDLFTKAMNLLDQPCDVYVKGDKEPRLLAIVMRAGNYFSLYKGHVVDRPSKIDGPVCNEAKEVVLSEDMIRKGLVDVDGHPLKTGLGKLFAMAKRHLSKGLDKAKKTFGKIKDGIGALVGGGWDGFKNWFKTDGLMISGGGKIIDRLDKIVDLLDTRLPARKKRKEGEDESGHRKNDYESIKKQRDEERAKKIADAKEAVKGKWEDAKNSKFGLGLMGLLSKLRGKKEGEEGDEKGGILDKISGIHDLWDMAKGTKLGGKLGGAAKWLGRGVKAVPKGLWGLGRGLLGRGALMAGAGELAGAGAGAAGGAGLAGAGAAAAGAAEAGAAAATAGTAAAGTGLGSMILGGLGTLASGAATAGGAILGGIGTAAGAAASGIGALMSAPVVLGALAVGATAYAGYKLYKYATRNDMNPFEKLRYAQYGFKPDDPQYWAKMKELEKAVMDVVTFDDANPSVDEKHLKVKDVAESFGIDLNDNAKVANFINWYRNRFKAVFLTHLMAWKKTNAQVKFDNLYDDLKPEEKTKFLGMAKFAEGPYNYMVSPFPELKQLTAGKAEVTQAADDATKDIQGDAKDKDKAKPASPAAAATTAATAVTGASLVGASQTAGAKPTSLADQLDQQMGKGIGDYSKIDDKGMKPGAGTLTVTGSVIPTVAVSNGRVDALSAIRFKAYGLKELEPQKIRALATLENGMPSLIRFNAKKVAEWNGGTQDVINRFGPAFGVDTNDALQSALFAKWFAMRFLPVYLNFASVVYANTGKVDPILGMNTLNEAQNLDVAMAIVGSSGGDGVPVWSVGFSPWKDYSLNMKSSTTDENLAAIKQAANQKAVSEEKGKTTDTTQSKSAAAAAGAATQGQGQTQEKSLLDKAGDMLKSGWDAVANSGVGKAVGAGVDFAKDAMGAAKDAVAGAGQAAGRWVGDMLGMGSGGEFEKLPKPIGDGSMGAYKGLIDAASKMAGVDPKLMLTMAAIESNFKAAAKAGTSSATGLYQFISGTWKTMLSRYGSKYGIPEGTSPLDPRANALMGAEYIKENAKALKGVKSQLTDTDLYLAHFLGAGGAKQLLKLDPNANAVQAMPSAAMANKPIFFEGGGAGRPRTAAEVYAEVNRRVRTRAQQVGAETGNAVAATSQPVVTAKAPSPTATAQMAPTAPASDVAPNAAPMTASAAAPSVAPLAAKSKAVKTSLPALAGSAGADVTPSLLTPQAKANAANQGIDLTETNNWMAKSFKVQTDTLAAIMAIQALLANRPAKSSEPSPSDSSTTPAKPVKASRQTQALGEVPVDPLRRVFG